MSSTISIVGSREAKLLEFMRSDFTALEGSHKKNSSFLIRLDKQFIELIKGTKNVCEKEAIVYSISRFTLSMLLAISVSTAVLYNAYDHFKGLFAEECRESGFEHTHDAYRLIHCQIVKIYDLKRRCQSMERFFRKLGSRRQNIMYNRSKKRKRRKSNIPPSTQKTVRYTHFLYLYFVACMYVFVFVFVLVSKNFTDYHLFLDRNYNYERNLPQFS